MTDDLLTDRCTFDADGLRPCSTHLAAGVQAAACVFQTLKQRGASTAEAGMAAYAAWKSAVYQQTPCADGTPGVGPETMEDET